MARVLKGSHSFTCTPRVHPLTEWTIPAFAFPAEAGTHLLTPVGWKAEFALMIYTHVIRMIRECIKWETDDRVVGRIHAATYCLSFWTTQHGEVPAGTRCFSHCCYQGNCFPASSLSSLSLSYYLYMTVGDRHYTLPVRSWKWSYAVITMVLRTDLGPNLQKNLRTILGQI